MPRARRGALAAAVAGCCWCSRAVLAAAPCAGSSGICEELQNVDDATGALQLLQMASTVKLQTQKAAPQSAAQASPELRRSAKVRQPPMDDPLVAWLLQAGQSARRLVKHLSSSTGQIAPESLMAVQTLGQPGSVVLPTEDGFDWNDVLTLTPGVASIVLFSGLVWTFLRQIMRGDAKAEGESGEVEEPGVKGSSGPQTVFNIVKNIVGEGMLSLPAGVAAGTGVLGAMVIATGFCMLLGYTFSLMGRVCHATGGNTHKACGEKASGPALAQLMAVTLMLKTCFTCLSYAIVIGESFSRILHFFGLSGSFASKQFVLLGMTGFVLLPLCLQRDLSILSFTSLVGIGGEVFVVLFMQVRYLDGSYVPGGAFYDAIQERYQPDFGTEGVNYWRTHVGTFVLLSSLSTAYIAHYNGPKFYSQMKRRTVDQFNKVVTVAFMFTLSIYLWVMTVGYLTFGNASDGLILNNYSEHDAGATAARVAIGLAVLFGFPLGFTALRDSTISFFGLDGGRPDVWLVTTLALLTPITATGCMVSDLGLVNSLGGAVFGGLIVLVFPGLLCYYSWKNTEGGAKEFLANEAKGSWLLVVLGLILCVFGSTIVLLKKFSPESLK